MGAIAERDAQRVASAAPTLAGAEADLPALGATLTPDNVAISGPVPAVVRLGAMIEQMRKKDGTLARFNAVQSEADRGDGSGSRLYDLRRCIGAPKL